MSQALCRPWDTTCFQHVKDAFYNPVREIDSSEIITCKNVNCDNSKCYQGHQNSAMSVRLDVFKEVTKKKKKKAKKAE